MHTAATQKPGPGWPRRGDIAGPACEATRDARAMAFEDGRPLPGPGPVPFCVERL